MSLCRWSGMDWQCDLYCYESENGYITHVGVNRIVGDIPKVDNSLIVSGDFDKYVEQHRKQMEFLNTTERKPIGLKYDGQTFYDNKETIMATLKMLREEGYRFPEITQEDIDD